MRNFIGDIFLLVLSVSNTFVLGAGSVAGSRVSSLFGVETLSSIGNVLLKTFFLASKHNFMLFRIGLFSTVYTSLSIPFNSLTNLLCSLSVSYNVNFYLYISLKKAIANAYLLKV